MIIRRTVAALLCVGMLPVSMPSVFAFSRDVARPSPTDLAAVRTSGQVDAIKTTYAVYQFLKHIKDFSALKSAIDYAKQYDHAVVRNTSNQSVAWTNYINRYAVVYADGKSWYCNSLAQAEATASKTPSTYVIDACLWKKVWRNPEVYAYQVESNSTVLQRYISLDDAMHFAQSTPGCRVVNIASNNVVYTGPAAYTFAVLDAKGTILKRFTDENAALSYAKTMVDSQVQSLKDKSVVWQYPTYEVYSHSTYDLLASYATLDAAVAYAQTVNQSYVVLAKTSQVVWANPDSYSSDGLSSDNSTGNETGSSDNSSGDNSTGTNDSTSTNDSTGSDNSSTDKSTGNATGSQTNSGLPSVYYRVSKGMVYKHLWSGSSFVVGPAAAFMKNGQNYANEGTKFYLVTASGAWQYAGNYESPYRQVDLRIKSNITASQIKDFILANNNTSPLAALSDVYVQAQQEYGVSAQYLVAHSILESAYGTSQIAHDKNNLFGYSAYDNDPYNSATTFPSMAYAIMYEAWFVRKNYLEPDGMFYNGSNLDGMNVKYATDVNWSESIGSIMWQMKPYNSADYKNQSIPPINSQEPLFLYVPGATGTVIANQVNVRSQPTVLSAVYKQVNTGATVSLTGWAPGWYQIALPDKRTAYISSTYVKPTNLGKIIGDEVNIRTTPSLLGLVVEQANYGDELITLSKSSDGQWLQVELMDGKKGYVSAQYIAALQ